MNKRLFSLFTALILVLSAAVMPMSAAGASSVAITSSVGTNIVSSSEPQEITFSVILSNPNPTASDIAGLNFDLKSSSDKLVLSTEATSLTTAFGDDSATYYAPRFAALKLNGIYAAPITEENVTLITIKATLAANAPAGKYKIFTENMKIADTNSNAVYRTNVSLELNISEAPVAVTGVSIPETLTLTYGGELQTLTANVDPINAANKDVEWSVVPAGIVTVDANGKVTPVKVGTATITVTTVDGNFTDTCTVTVVAQNIIITEDDINIADAGKYTGSAIEPEVTVDGISTSDYVVSYSNNINAGTASVTVSPAPNGRYNFPPVTKNFTIDKADQIISGQHISLEVGESVDLSTLFSAEGALSYSIANGATISGTVLTAGDTPGTYALEVTAAATENYNAVTRGYDVIITVDTNDDPFIPPALINYTLTFETNGGSNIAPVNKLAGSGVEFNNYVPTKAGYEFAGWYSDKTLTEKVTSIRLNKSMTVYAKWTEIPVIDESCNGGKDCPSYSLTDVDQKQWYHEGIDFVVANGMMNGVGNNKFDPHGITSRAMIVTILHRLEGEPTVTDANPFSDVKNDIWYTDAVIWAEANGIVNGYGNGKFGPEDDITREQMAKIMYNYAEYKGYAVSARASLASFSDADKISSWATEEVQWTVAVGLINGMGDGTVAPQGDAERCQVAAIFMRFCDKYVK